MKLLIFYYALLFVSFPLFGMQYDQYSRGVYKTAEFIQKEKERLTKKLLKKMYRSMPPEMLTIIFSYTFLPKKLYRYKIFKEHIPFKQALSDPFIHSDYYFASDAFLSYCTNKKKTFYLGNKRLWLFGFNLFYKPISPVSIHSRSQGEYNYEYALFTMPRNVNE